MRLLHKVIDPGHWELWKYRSLAIVEYHEMHCIATKLIRFEDNLLSLVMVEVAKPAWRRPWFNIISSHFNAAIQRQLT